MRPIFDDHRRLARTDDPSTSKLAAAEIVKSLGRLQRWVYELILQHPDMTVNELAERAGARDPRMVGRRVPELERKDLIASPGSRKCSITGHEAKVWVAVGVS